MTHFFVNFLLINAEPLLTIIVKNIETLKNIKVMNGNENMPKSGRLIFGIFMVIVYVAVGLLFIFDVFNIDNVAVSAVVGGILCAYGLWRGYRLYRGWN